MNVLVINCGSSSLKYQLIDSETESSSGKGSLRENRYRRTSDLSAEPATKKIIEARHADTIKKLSDWFWMH